MAQVEAVPLKNANEDTPISLRDGSCGDSHARHESLFHARAATSSRAREAVPGDCIRLARDRNNEAVSPARVEAVPVKKR